MSDVERNSVTKYDIVQYAPPAKGLFTVRKIVTFDYVHCDTRERAVELINVLVNAKEQNK